MSTRFRALQHRNFQLFIGGQLISLIGTWMQSTAQLWLVYKLTGSAALLGVFGFANQVPILFLASIGGYVGDRYHRHYGVIATQTASMILAFALAALTFAEAIKVWELILVAFLVGIVNAFDVPIRQSFIVQMVVKEDLPNAIALNSSIFNGARVVGPAIAGFALAWKGPAWCFLFNGISFLAVLAALLAMRIQKIALKKPEGSPFHNFIQGFRFVMRDVPMRSALLLLGLLSMLGLQYSVFLPIFAVDILHRGAKGFGLLMSTAGVGAVMGALYFAGRTSYKGISGQNDAARIDVAGSQRELARSVSDGRRTRFLVHAGEPHVVSPRPAQSAGLVHSLSAQRDPRRGRSRVSRRLRPAVPNRCRSESTAHL